MKTTRLIYPLLTCIALLMGCATQRELVEKRIVQRAAFFAALPAEDQQRLRDGRVVTGDSRDAAYIVYGRPDRVFQKEAGAATNEVWSYVAQDITTHDQPRPLYHSLRPTPGGGSLRPDRTWATDRSDNPYEYRRIEFQNDRILKLDADKP